MILYPLTKNIDKDFFNLFFLFSKLYFILISNFIDILNLLS